MQKKIIFFISVNPFKNIHNSCILNRVGGAVALKEQEGLVFVHGIGKRKSPLQKSIEKEDLERILTEEGCMLRMNRSIQAEGSFGELKQDMSFRRYLSRGTPNVTAESILLAIAHNKIRTPQVRFLFLIFLLLFNYIN